MEGQVIELAYALDTFYFLVMGAFLNSIQFVKKKGRFSTFPNNEKLF